MVIIIKSSDSPTLYAGGTKWDSVFDLVLKQYITRFTYRSWCQYIGRDCFDGWDYKIVCGQRELDRK